MLLLATLPYPDSHIIALYQGTSGQSCGGTRSAPPISVPHMFGVLTESVAGSCAAQERTASVIQIGMWIRATSQIIVDV